MVSQKNKPIISILGDQGLIGSWMRSVFSVAGYTVLGTDIATKDQNSDNVTKSRIVLLAVPLMSTAETVNEISSVLTEDHLLVDFTSIKTKANKVFEKLNCKLLSLHPMFAPYGRDFTNEKIVVCNTREHQVLTPLVLAVLKRNNLDLIFSDIKEHDEIMSLVQGITHFLSLALLLTIKKSGISAEKTFDFASPIYKMRLASACRIVMQDPGLYHGIFAENEFFPEILDNLEESIKQLKQLLGEKDQQKTSELFLSLRNELGTQAQKSFIQTEKLIEFLRHLKEE